MHTYPCSIAVDIIVHTSQICPSPSYFLRQLLAISFFYFETYNFLTFQMCCRDRDRFSRVTNEDLQDQLDDLRRMLVDLRKEVREKEEPGKVFKKQP